MNLNDLFTEEKVRLDPHCWHNKKIGNPKTKVKGGTRVNNCVPKESVAEGADANAIWNQYGQYSVQDLAQEFPNLSPKDAQTIVNYAEYGWTNVPNRQEYRDEVVKRVQQAMGNQQGMAEGVMSGAEELNIGDPVVITGNVEFEGKTGDIVDFGQDKRFVVVNLYNHGQQSFHSSDVSYNDYAGSDDMNADDHDDDMDEGKQKPGADYIDPPEDKDPDQYGDDYQAMVSRVKKLAGLGPMKTVYDPAKRVYRNVPTAVQPKK